MLAIRSKMGFIASLITVTLLFHIGCANSNQNKFHNKIIRMSDAELLEYYNGINDRLKDIEHGMERHETTLHPRVTAKHYIYQTPFSTGGEGYHLIRNRKMILEELRVRSIHPHGAILE